MRFAVVQIVPLIGEQDAVGLVLAQLVRQPPADVLVVVGIAVGDGRHLDQLGAAQAQHVLLFLALGIGNDDQGAVAAGIGDEREPDAGVAGGALDHQPAGLDLAALFRLQDHLAAGAVLHRLAGIHEFGLAQNGAAGRRGGALERDQRRVADGFDDSVAESALRSVRLGEGRTNLFEPFASDKIGLPVHFPHWLLPCEGHAGERKRCTPVDGRLLLE